MTLAFPTTIIAEAGSNKGLLSIPVERVKAAIVESGAVLFRGFDVDVETFSKWSKQFMTKPFTHGYKALTKKDLEDPESRKGLGGRLDVTADRTVTTVNVGFAAIPLHGDVSPWPVRPDLAFFCCIRPADSGGETTIGDGAEIPAAMSAAARDLFANNRVKFRMRVTTANLNLMFGTHTREDLRAALEFWRIKAESRGESFRVLFRDEHPELFSAASDPDDPDDALEEYITPATPKRRDGRRVFCSHLVNAARYDYLGKAWPSVDVLKQYESHQRSNVVTFENGEVIPDDALEELEAACARAEVPIDWRPHDVVMIDNWRTPHGRRAHADTKRNILTTFGYCDFVEQVIPQ